ncbi:glycosyltransferase family 32 protein [Acinetobacter nectaris]|uniref:glycosyltransferase family 32 protein n=1 Tax=Acinetobacter nectaris TaxID=1219382 RepID=UPI001F3FEB94|nr:capsular polysaccharide synthesis protein [Acinetobacter nectaris]MCF9045708.1 hypothetical protein [Acinetobacter nectaris]
MGVNIISYIKAIFLAIKAIFNFIFRVYSGKEVWFFQEDSRKNYKAKGIPKKIWMYWDSEEPNLLVDYCINNTINICSDYEVIVLNSYTVKDYINIPDIDFSGIKKAVVADYIRLALLKKYGGVWMDASIFITQNFDWFLNRIDNNTNFLFYSDPCTYDIDNPIFENWFIAAPEGSELITDWFNEFEKCFLSSDPTKYYSKYANSKILQGIPNTDYLMCYISIAKVTANKKYNIASLNSASSGHYYNYKLFSNSFLIAIVLMLRNLNKVFVPKLIKFTKDTRYYPNLFVSRKIIAKSSIFSKGN